MRHPLIFAAWIILLGLSTVAYSYGAEVYVLVFLSAPVLALVTLATVGKPSEELELVRAWRWPHRAVLAALVVAGLAGLVGVASGMSLRNTPAAILFLFAVVFGWRALVDPTPKRTAYPAALLHVSWLPLLIANFIRFNYSHNELADWQVELAFFAGIAILATSGVASMLTAFVFAPSNASAIPVARLR